MHFAISSVALLALSAGVSAVVANTEHEPPVYGGKSVGKYQATGATGISTGTHPIVTGPVNNGTHGGKNSTAIVTSTAPCFSCHGSSTIPVSVPSKTPGGSGGSGSSGSGSGSGTGTGGSGSGSGSGTGTGTGGSGSGSGSGTGTGTGGSGSGAGSGSGSESGNGAASPSSTGFNPSNPGSKVTIPQVGAMCAVMAYGAVMFLA